MLSEFILGWNRAQLIQGIGGSTFSPGPLAAHKKTMQGERKPAWCERNTTGVFGEIMVPQCSENCQNHPCPNRLMNDIMRQDESDHVVFLSNVPVFVPVSPKMEPEHGGKTGNKKNPRAH